MKIIDLLHQRPTLSFEIFPLKNMMGISVLSIVQLMNYRNLSQILFQLHMELEDLLLKIQ